MIRLNLNGRRRNRNRRTGRAHRHHRVFPLTRFLVLIGMSAFTFLSLLNSEHLILKEALKQKNRIFRSWRNAGSRKIRT